MHIPLGWLKAKLEEVGLSENVKDLIKAEMVRRRDETPEEKKKHNRGGGVSIMRTLSKKIVAGLTPKEILELPEARIAQLTLQAKVLGLKTQPRPIQTQVPVAAQPQVIRVEHNRPHQKARQSDKSTTTIYKSAKPYEFLYNAYITNYAVHEKHVR
jgi:hypothetical protein